MSHFGRILIRHLLPLLISGAAMVYVFGYAIDWEAIPEATERAQMPLFIAITVIDKIVFFLVWSMVQASMVRRFLVPVPRREVIAVKGAAELLRAVNSSLSDAAFFLGVWRLCRVPLQAVVAVTTLPFIAHFFVLLLQGTLALGFLPRDQVRFSLIAGVVGFGWLIVAIIAIAHRVGITNRLYRLFRLDWLEGQGRFKDLLPYLGVFAGFAAVDVLIQGLASRAFGIQIDWLALMAGIPVLYLMMMVPSFGNFGTREIIWANLFHGYGSSASLYAFALWTNVIFLVMHVLIGALFMKRTLSLLAELRERRHEVDSARPPILRDALDP